MANIKTLQMWNTICTDARISVSKSLFGMRTTVTYQPTGSQLDVIRAEYQSADGERLKHILTSPRETLAKAIDSFHPKNVANGNYMAEVCVSSDGAFLAVQLLHFSQLSYEPATDVLIFEDDEARLVRQLF